MTTSPQLKLVRNVSATPDFEANDRARFLSVMLDTFSRTRHGIAGDWQYSSSAFLGDKVRGARLWQSFLKNSTDYYPIRNETKLIREDAAGLLGDIDEPIILADLGPGPVQPVLDKTMPIARLFKNLAGYCPVDVNREYLTIASQTVKKEFPGIFVQGIHADFFKDEIVFPANAKIIALFFGSSISNLEGAPGTLPEDEIVDQLSRLRRILRPGSSLLMAYDSNQDKESVIRSYMHEDQIAFGANLMHRVKRDFPVSSGFDPDAWHYEPVWYAESHQLCHVVFCDKDQRFSLGRTLFDIKKGEIFVLNNSFKYPVQKMNQWGTKAGFKQQRYVSDSEGRSVLHLMLN